MPRTTAAYLISQVRGLIGDTNSPYRFTDDEIQDALDGFSLAIIQERLKNAHNLVYESNYAWWETAVLTASNGVVVNPDKINLRFGRWEFTTAQNGDLFVTGASHDVYGAAAQLLEVWASSVSLDFDFSADGASYQRSQKQAALLNLANLYLRKARPVSVKMERSDVI